MKKLLLMTTIVTTLFTAHYTSDYKAEQNKLEVFGYVIQLEEDYSLSVYTK